VFIIIITLEKIIVCSCMLTIKITLFKARVQLANRSHYPKDELIFFLI